MSQEKQADNEAVQGDAADQDPNGEYVLVDLRSVVGNCAMFWRNGGSGYTCELDEAHVFSEKDAFGQHRSRPDVDWPIPKTVAAALVNQHVDRSALFKWARDNQDPRRTDPYGAQPRENVTAATDTRKSKGG